MLAWHDWGMTTHKRHSTFKCSYLLISRNIGSLTGRLTELVDAMVRRNVSILYVQKTKLVGEKDRIIES